MIEKVPAGREPPGTFGVFFVYAVKQKGRVDPPFEFTLQTGLKPFRQLPSPL